MPEQEDVPFDFYTAFKLWEKENRLPERRPAQLKSLEQDIQCSGGDVEEAREQLQVDYELLPKLWEKEYGRAGPGSAPKPATATCNNQQFRLPGSNSVAESPSPHVTADDPKRWQLPQHLPKAAPMDRTLPFETSFDAFVPNKREAKPRSTGLTEVRGPYYSVMGRRYLEDLLDTMGAHIDTLKFAGAVVVFLVYSRRVALK